jgi:hypothetical protein
MAKAQGYAFFYLDGQKISNREAFFTEVYSVFSLPQWCGPLWDGIADCLEDLHWIEGGTRGHIVLYDNFQKFMTTTPDEFNIAFSILDQLKFHWRIRMKRSFYVLLKGDENLLDYLPQIISE